MWASRRALVFSLTLALIFNSLVLHSQSPTTGRLKGTVKDSQGAVIAGATITFDEPATATRWILKTENDGSYSTLPVPPGIYQLTVQALGFNDAILQNLQIALSATTTVNVQMKPGTAKSEIVVSDVPPMIRSDSAGLASSLDSRSLEALPLPSRNALQLLTQVPGVTAPLTNNSALGRNTPNVSSNGARVTQNSYQVNGVDASNISTHDFGDVGIPAPESIRELRVQTSLYDASVGDAGGAAIQVITKSGSDFLHGSAYEYFRNEALNANDPNLKAVGVERPVMKRNVFGGTLGGPLVKNRAFFFISYQGTREKNGATSQSLFKDVLIAPGLTNDRTEPTLLSTFAPVLPTGTTSIDPVALRLLNTKLPGGTFLIPTPQTSDGHVSGTTPSTFHEEQFNTNFDLHIRSEDFVSMKLFFADAPLFSALGGSNFSFAASTLPGFGNHIDTRNIVLSLSEEHVFSNRAVNELRFGYGLVRRNELPQEPVTDADVGISRGTANQNPGLPLILLDVSQEGAAIGTSNIILRNTLPSKSVGDMFSFVRGKHNLRLGGEFHTQKWDVEPNVFTYGEIDFDTFGSFLAGTSSFSHLATGIPHRDFRTTDYHAFVQDDWRLANRFTVNLGLRYELDLPPYEVQGRIGGFNPTFYAPRMQLDSSGIPLGPPASGIIEAGNALPQFSLPEVHRVGKRILKSVDPNNFGPRIGFAWSPIKSERMAIRGGYGIFYSRPSFSYLALDYFAPPFFLDSVAFGQPIESPFANAPPNSAFPLIQPGGPLAVAVVDTNNRTPYTQQFNFSVQHELLREATLQVAYVGSRGVKLFRSLAVNQARIATSVHPVINAVTSQVITTNTPDNALLRSPMQGVDSAFFALNESTAQSAYHSLQTTFSRRWTHGLEFSASYTWSKSVDNASQAGGGAFSDGSLDRSGALDTGNVFGNQFGPHTNRGLSDFDRTHCFVMSYSWELPIIKRSNVPSLLRWMFSNWQVSGVVTAMSGVPVDIVDPVGGSLYGLVGSRPNWSAGADRRTATSQIPSGYYFNPSAFSAAVVSPGDPIPSAHDPLALAGDVGLDLGNVGRNVLRGPAQSNIDFSLSKGITFRETSRLDFRADFFNVLNHANRDNPVSDINRSDFGRVVAFSSSPRIIQLGLKVSF